MTPAGALGTKTRLHFNSAHSARQKTLMRFGWFAHRLFLVAIGAATLLSVSGCTVGPSQTSVTSTGKPPDVDPFLRLDQRATTDASHVTRLPPVNPAAGAAPTGELSLVAHHEPVEIVLAEGLRAGASNSSPPGALHLANAQSASELPSADAFPIDLSGALRLGGANNLQIELARQRVREAETHWTEARAALLPSLWLGVGYNKHDGRLQETEGPILEVSRNSLFVGGGAGLDGSSVAGGSSGPSRLVLNLSLADAAFEPLVGLQLLDAEEAAESATVNDALLAIATAYFDLVEAHSHLANAHDALDAAEEMVELATLFAEEGQGSLSEKYRAEAEQAHWRQTVEDAHRHATARSAELARLLHLGGGVTLVPVEDRMVPVEMVEESTSVEALVATGLQARPEMAQYQSLVDAAVTRVRQECLRPWLPYIQLGASAGAFGGGPSSQFDNQSGRSDVDVLAVWELKNLGLGNISLRRRRASQMHQAEVEAEAVQDKIIAEIITAAADVGSYRRQIDSTGEGVAAADKSYQANLERIREAEGLPIELLQAVRARAASQNAHTVAISNYNRAQFHLLRALGRPPGVADGETVTE